MAQATQQVIWTALPNGLADDGRLRLSVLISPRLTLAAAPPVLGNFADWLDWPAKLASAAWQVEIDGDKREAEPISTPRSAVWQALFPPTTHVASRKFDDLSGRLILSYPVADTARLIERVYQDLAVAADDDLPTARSFGPLARPLQRPREPAAVLRELRDGGSGRFGAELPDALDLLGAYHRPLERTEIGRYENQGPGDPQPSSRWRTQRLAPLPKPQDFQKLIDFHQVVAALGQHPLLMRLCGLVVDLAVDAPAAPASGRVRVLPEWAPDAGVTTLPDQRPATAYALDRPVFGARARDPDASFIAGPWLRLTPKAFDVVQLDVDGAGLKLRNFALSVWRTQDESQAIEDFAGDVTTEPHRTGAPSLRSGGLTLAQRRRDRAVSTLLKGARQLQDQHEAGGDLTLFAEDLVRGYRADVRDDRTGRWQSLCRRDGVYTLVNDGAILTSEDEEGVVRLAAAESADGENPDVLKIHEGLFVWRGWSLCAPLPMPALGLADEVAEPENAAPEGLPLEADFTVRRGSLPSLRFGRSYQMRLRLVDLAGNSAPYDPALEAPPGVASAAEAFLRHEPVEPPNLALVAGAGEDPLDGESMTRLAVRTFNDTFDAPPPAAPPQVRRQVLAPRVSHLFAERSGALDTADGVPDPDLFPLLAARDIAPPEVELESEAWAPDEAPPPVPVRTRYAAAPETYALTYLPDPLARGVVIRVLGLAHVDPQEIFRIDLYPGPARWPDAAPFRIALVAGDAAPTFEASRREFRVALGLAERARLRISSLLRGGDLDVMALWRLIERRALPEDELAALRERALRGQHWMLTPWREVDLVHAVQRPLVRPAVQGFSSSGAASASRSLGRTPARIGFGTPLHANSTGRLDLQARWQDPRDSEVGGPDSRESRAQAQSWTISRRDAPDGRWAQRSALHDFPDTRYRRVLYRLEATTRFREYMPPALRAAAEGAPLKVVSEESRVWIPNAAPPPPPQVRYVIPTFGWTRAAEGEGRRASWRRGGGLRVYLDRPWFASGHGEMLGVVLPSPNATVDDLERPQAAHVTQWGADPIWLGGEVERPAPALHAFPLRIRGGPVPAPGAPPVFAEEGADLPETFDLEGHTLPGLDGALRVDVAPHAVGYDAGRRLWYCDIVVRPGDAYFPFIRLALARYHPVSAHGAHLSAVVLAAFQQLTPDRHLSVTRDGRTVNVAVHGHVSAKTLPGLEAGQVEVELQELAPGGDPDLDWRTIQPPPELVARPDDERWAGQVTTRDLRAAARLTARTEGDRAQALEAERLSAGQRFEDLVARPELLRWLTPPLIWEGEVRLPADHAGRNLRLMVVEREIHPTSAPDGRGVTPRGDRIVYAEAIPL